MKSRCHFHVLTSFNVEHPQESRRHRLEQYDDCKRQGIDQPTRDGYIVCFRQVGQEVADDEDLMRAK